MERNLIRGHRNRPPAAAIIKASKSNTTPPRLLFRYSEIAPIENFDTQNPWYKLRNFRLVIRRNA